MQLALGKMPVVIPTDKGNICIYLAGPGKPNTVVLPARCGIDLTLGLLRGNGYSGRRLHVPPFHQGWKIIIPGVKTDSNTQCGLRLRHMD